MNNPEEYKSALDWLFSQLPMFSRVGLAAYKPGLDTSHAIDTHFNHPHRKFKSIHIGGTNGKGSTSHMLASILQTQGYKTGLYTSPHLVDFRERMRINGKMIPEEKVIEFVNEWRACDYDGHPSFFELTMMMAFDWFAKEKVDYAIIEVGMGGRLDSTNIITPEMCVITNISNDHTQFLGDTLPKIASEKAGIIKQGIPVIIGEAEGEIRKIFEQRAKEVGAPIIFAEDHPQLLSITEINTTQSLHDASCFNTMPHDISCFNTMPHDASCCRQAKSGWLCSTSEGEMTIPLPGDYQKKNINTVLNAVKGMREAGITISSESVVTGMEGVHELTGLQGRWTILSNSPLTIADTGHNIAGITYNMAQLRRLLSQRPGARLHIVIGFVADKAIDKILKLLPEDAVYYLTNAQIPRALPAPELRKHFNEAGLDGEVFPDVRTAFATAQKDAKADDIIFIGGSTFIVADLLS